MPYSKQTWQGLPNRATPVTASRLNHLETQYDESMKDSKLYTDNTVATAKLWFSDQLAEAIGGIPLPDNIDPRLLYFLNKTTTTWVFLGSSTTSNGGYIKSMHRSITSSFGLGTYGTTFPPPGTPGIHFVNEGQGNTTSGNYLPSQRLTRIRDANPDVVFHAIGSNDWYYGTSIVQYKANLNTAINSLRQTGLPLQVLMHQHERKDITGSTLTWDDFGKAMKEVASEHPDVIFLDVSNSMRSVSVGVGLPNWYGLLSTDNVHLTVEGQDVLGLVTLSALGMPTSKVTDWVPVELSGGYAGTLEYRMVGSSVNVRWDYPNVLTAGTSRTIATLPEAIRPPISVPVPCFGTGYRLLSSAISTGGAVLLKNMDTQDCTRVQGYVSYTL